MADTVPTRLSYGDEPDQFVTLYESTAGGDGAVLLVHGGYWRSALTEELMNPLVEYFLREDIAVANIEYRRGPENAWPIPIEDVSAAVQLVRKHVSGHLCGIGHSVGGQLVLLANQNLDSTVALAPVTDTARVHTEGLGDDAAPEYFQRSPEEAPSVYASSSAVHQGAVEVPTLVVHGANDDRVPLRHSLDYTAAQWTAGAPVDTLFLHSLDHLECIQPQHSAWRYINDWVRSQLTGTD